MLSPGVRARTGKVTGTLQARLPPQVKPVQPVISRYIGTLRLPAGIPVPPHFGIRTVRVNRRRPADGLVTGYELTNVSERAF